MVFRLYITSLDKLRDRFLHTIFWILIPSDRSRHKYFYLSAYLPNRDDIQELENNLLYGMIKMKNDPWERLKGYADYTFDKLANLGYEKLELPEKVFICVWSLQGEVDNGGFDQWLFNSSGDWALDTPKFLREINAPLTALMVENVIKIFPKGSPPKDINQRREIMKLVSDDTSEKWNQISNQFYKKEEDLDTLLLLYAEKNINKG